MISKLHELTGLSEKQISKWQWDQIHKENNSQDSLLETPKRVRHETFLEENSRVSLGRRRPPAALSPGFLDILLSGEKPVWEPKVPIEERFESEEKNESPAKSQIEWRIFEPLILKDLCQGKDSPEKKTAI